MTRAEIAQSNLHDSVRFLIQSGQDGARWERRQHTRYPYTREVIINHGSDDPKKVLALTREISQIGVGLLHRTPFRPQETMSMTIQYGEGVAITVPISCVWCRPCGPHWFISGSCFQDIPQDDQPCSAHSWDPKNTLAYRTIKSLLSQNFEEMSERSEYDPILDKRCEKRYHVNLPVIVMPADEGIRPTVAKFHAVTHDISSKGIGFFVAKNLDSRYKYLLVQVMDLEGHIKLEATMNVLRSQPIGDLYSVGGQFVSNKYFHHR